MFSPQKYFIPDRAGEPFIDPGEIRSFLDANRAPQRQEVIQAVGSALEFNRLTLEQTAVLLNAGAGERQLVFDAAGTLKQRVYGDRIVVFAPLYIGSKCVNDCSYCGFRASNPRAVRRTLGLEEIASQVRQLTSTGQKRLILVFGEHPLYDPGFIA